ncbi:LVIVD repeat-containing protein [Hymenobacter sp. B81]|uniref:LVIVD repeat-containing protein n=1 Tax=Hymenobacter sp. B81 TaxID=3344878 RepID=UPI0037DD4EC2
MSVSAILRACALLLTLATLPGCDNADSASPRMGADNGKAGSMARFAVLGNTLYTVDGQSLRVFDLSNPAAPVPAGQTPLGVGIETIFPQAPYLFIGTQMGMFVFDASNPLQPRQLSFYRHAVSCDPVVVDGRYAYLTLREGRTCGGGINQLQVIDLQDLNAPRLAQSYPMTKPYGLGTEDQSLFVCDDGLKVFDTRLSPTLTQTEHHAIEAYDVIPDQGRLFVIGPGGLYQYQHSGGRLTRLSVLPITPR